MTVEADKDALRRRLLASRRSVTAEQWAADDDARTRLALGAPWTAEPGTAALYAARSDEPGTRALIDALSAAGWVILLPVLTRDIRWAVFEGWPRMRPGWRGIPVPVGDPLPPSALAAARLVVVPCLAVGRDGTRLGTGGGWYDRALPHRSPTARIVALARNTEVLETVPVLPHDVPVDGYLTERVSVDLDR